MQEEKQMEIQNVLKKKKKVSCPVTLKFQYKEKRTVQQADSAAKGASCQP